MTPLPTITGVHIPANFWLPPAVVTLDAEHSFKDAYEIIHCRTIELIRPTEPAEIALRHLFHCTQDLILLTDEDARTARTYEPNLRATLLMLFPEPLAGDAILLADDPDEGEFLSLDLDWWATYVASPVTKTSEIW